MEDTNNAPQYFTAEFEQRVREMSDADMFQLLYEIEQTPYWVALVRYNQLRSGQIQSGILTADPVREPTQIARNQGIMMGLADLQNAIVMLWQERAMKAKAAEAVVSEDGTNVE